MRKFSFGITRLVLTTTAALSLAFFSVLPAAAAAPRVEVGIAAGTSLYNLTDAELQRRLEDMKRLGANWIRIDFSWANMQPHSPNRFDFRHTDKVVVAAENLGIKIMGTLAYTPPWARNTRCVELVSPNEESRQKCPPRDMNEFARFAREVAVRYQKHGVLAYEIWNEPNLVGYWKSPMPDGRIWVNPEAFARLSNAVAAEIRKIEPTIIITTGGLAPVFEPDDPRGMRQGDFLRRMAPLLVKGGVDGVAIHPYTWPVSPRRAADWNAFYTVDNGTTEYNWRRILGQINRNDLMIWATEYGASTTGLAPAGTTTRPDHVDESMQAQIIREGIEDWYHKAHVGALFVYADNDKYLPQYRNEGGFGVRRIDESPKPSYQVMQSAITSTRTTIQSLARQ